VLARLRPHAHAAMTGDLDPGLAEPVLEAATAAYGEIIMAPAWPRLTPISKIQTEQTHLQVRYLHEVLMPRLVSHALSDDDATAFDGLGPAM